MAHKDRIQCYQCKIGRMKCLKITSFLKENEKELPGVIFSDVFMLPFESKILPNDCFPVKLSSEPCFQHCLGSTIRAFAWLGHSG